MSRSSRLGGSVAARLSEEDRLDALLCRWRPLRALGRSAGRRARMLFYTVALRDPDHVGATALFSALGRMPWLRAPDAWNEPGLEGLVRHLLVRVRHPLPPWLLPLAIDGCAESVALIARLGDAGHLGGSPLPTCLTRRMLHELTVLPRADSLGAAVRTAQIHALGGGPELVDAVLETRLRTLGAAEPWWQATLAWLVRVGLPEEPGELGPLVDFLDAQRAAGVPPPWRQSLRRMLVDCARWHTQLAYVPLAEVDRRLPLPPWPRATMDAEGAAWLIRPMRTVFELYMEGRVLHHCVATYASRARNGHSSLWTMRRDGRRCATLEVDRDGVLVQARGRGNRMLDAVEWQVVLRWAEDAGIWVGSVAGAPA
ncbi:MAG: PcfJ domain-containing protein [Alphaproteobacteria bacterium]|nr:PcfJ domain-containing protein [Alphaproteobacteria bacterium]